ncbi:DUF5916 domain-containing protein [Flavobacterium sp. XGLA_31]|uniref:DUF5916 domain-containing protein n=1 Tax=Flavobacterium sp. XGLA_31 TaxID=3447666 RepID=UPI003F3BE7D1
MSKKSYRFLHIILLLSILSFGQKKVLQTKFTDEKITIDAEFDEEAWKTAAVATHFIMINPDNGKPIPYEKRTEVKIVYNNEAIYVAAKLYDNEPDKIRKELTSRDNFATADHFGVFFNGYNDGQQEFRFFVSAAGVQQDLVYTDANGEDYSWDAIWDSHVAITDYGWAVEMRIPYAALRFSTDVKQIWGLNFYREIMRDRQQYSWNFLDNKIPNESTQAGILDGINNIKTPTRLFFIPYSSQYFYASKEHKSNGEFKGGLDIKYGINDAFTLDAILIPDFGQTKFDNVELNLSAFEQQFSENRPFFTEGTDLFNKGDLLYTRRIGETPDIAVADNETILDKPGNIKLVNALKVSGRTKSGLGIGVMNAVSEKTSVTIQNDDTGTVRREILSPLTNYNVLVFDQRFNKNSSVSLTNTNVMRDGTYRDANVSALSFDLNTRKNTYNLNGNYKYSYINETADADNKTGFKSELYAAKSSGKYRYGLGAEYYSRGYDINDLGINFQTHYHSVYGNASYRLLKPTKKYNSYQSNLNFYSEFDNLTGRIQAGQLNLNINSTTVKNNYYGYGFNWRPLKTYDFYEPRTENERAFVTLPESFNLWCYYSSNYNKTFALDFNPFYNFLNEKDRVSYGFIISPRYRFNDRFSLVYNFNFNRQNNDIGWVAFDNDEVVFARRNRITYANTLQGKYSVNNKMNLNLSVRHYWSYVVNHNYMSLMTDGSLTDNTTFTKNKNSNLNNWNLDLSYSWWFAPGSQISVLYRNNSSLFTREFSHQFDHNFKEAVDNQNLSHIFSVSIRYFIDYNSVKNSRFARAFTKPQERIHF